MKDSDIADILENVAYSHVDFDLKKAPDDKPVAVFSSFAQAVFRHLLPQEYLAIPHIVGKHEDKIRDVLKPSISTADFSANVVQECETLADQLPFLDENTIALEYDTDHGQKPISSTILSAAIAANRLDVSIVIAQTDTQSNVQSNDEEASSHPLSVPGEPELNWYETSETVMASALPLDVHHLQNGGAELSDMNPQKALAQMSGKELLEECRQKRLASLGDDCLFDITCQAARDKIDIGNATNILQSSNDGIDELYSRACKRVDTYSSELAQRRRVEVKNEIERS